MVDQPDRMPDDASSLDEASVKHVDDLLRRGLEPHPAAVRRIQHRALDPQKRPLRWSFRFAAVATLLLIVALAIPRSSVEKPPSSEVVDVVPGPRVRISNQDDLVTVTSPSGAALMILPEASF